MSIQRKGKSEMASQKYTYIKRKQAERSNKNFKERKQVENR